MCGQRGRETRVEICVFLSKFLIGDSLPGVPNAPSCSVPCSCSLGMSAPDASFLALPCFLAAEGNFGVAPRNCALNWCLPKAGRHVPL